MATIIVFLLSRAQHIQQKLKLPMASAFDLPSYRRRRVRTKLATAAPISTGRAVGAISLNVLENPRNPGLFGGPSGI
jgi:hypothetical protein